MHKTIRILPVLLALVIALCPFASASTYSPIEASYDELAATNLFLSNFTEVYVDRICDGSDDQTLVDFAHDHLWYNDYESFEFGEYENDNNCRVSDDRIEEIIQAYFYDPRPVDLSQTRFDYIDGYYYHCETGGSISSGFAHTVSICPIEDDKYFVSFMVFGGGEFWDNSVLDDSMEEIEAAFGHPNGYGCALIYASDLSNRSTYKMISYSLA